MEDALIGGTARSPEEGVLLSIRACGKGETGSGLIQLWKLDSLKESQKF